MAQFVQVTPFLHVPDLARAIGFFEDMLGFATLFRMSDYAYVQRDGIGFRMLGPPGATVTPGTRRFAHYIDVRDVDALFAELRPRLDLLPPGDVHGPADKAYGQRELLVVGPDGDLIIFGQAIAGWKSLADPL